MSICSRCGILFILGLLMRVKHTNASASIHERATLQENEPTGTIVAELSKYLDVDITPGPKKNFQWLSEKLKTKYRNAANQRHRWFTVDEATGTVKLRRPIDREAVCGNSEQCAINIQIFEKQRSRLIELDVEILNVNEYPPTFPVSFILVNISEGANIGDTVNLDKYKASDKDTGNNSSITYSLNPSDGFSLKQFEDETGTPHLQVEVRQSLDYEGKSFYRLTLFANDNGFPTPKSSHVPFQIRVTDENDNVPVFDQKEYSFAFQESLQTGQVIARVQANDADSGLAGTVRYFLAGANKHITSSLVKINEITGEITLMKPLDRESFDELNIFIEARDLGKPRKIGRTRLVVYVSDVNDNAPVITVSFIDVFEGDTVYIPESYSKENFFAYVSAIDSDLGPNAEFSMKIKSSIPHGKRSKGIRVDASGTFFLNNNGFIAVNKKLDAETQNRYKITINATDEGYKPRWSSKDINVVVLDVNDHSPQFDRAVYNASVSESAKVGSNITTIRATDKDASNPSAVQLNELEEVIPSKNGDITYSISGGSSMFSVEPKTGVVSLVSPLDREQTSSWMINIVATDGGIPPLSTESHLYVRVTDTNDNPPLFTVPSRDGETVYATILRDDVILKIQAVDYDEGNNGKIRFKLISEDGVRQTSYVNTSLFMLDPKSGVLRLNMSKPDLSKSLGRHVIVVQARDSGSSPMKTECTINVVVTDRVVLPFSDSVKPHDGGMESSLLYIIIGSAVATFLVLTVVVIVALLKCKKHRKTLTSHQCKNAPDRPPLAMTDLYSAEVRSSTPVHEQSQDGEIEKEKDVWRRTSHHNPYNTLTSGSTTTDVTNLSRSDVLVTHQFLTLPQKASAISPSQTGSLDGRKLSPSTLAVPTNPRPQDGDSGRGDSDPDVISGDIPFEQDYPRQSVSQGKSPVSDTSHSNNLGRNCSQQCLRYGHSDACWMPQDRGPSCPVSSSAHLLTPQSNSRFTPSPSSEVASLPPSRTESSDQSSNLEPIPEVKPVRVFWPQAYNGSSLTSIYSKLLPPIYVDPASVDRRLETEESTLLKNGTYRNGSSTDSTTTGYVTEPEIV